MLPIELQQDYDLIDFGSKMLMQYFDSICTEVMTLVILAPVKFTHNYTTARGNAMLVT
jgi:hypothetical protein